MKQIVSPTLLKTMKNDPWFTPGDTQLDTSGLSPEFRPQTVEENDFNVPLCNTKHHASREAWAREAILDPEILSNLAACPNLTEDEEQLLREYSNPSFTFFAPQYEISAEWRTGRWHCLAVHQESGERKKFIAGGFDKSDRDGLMGFCSRYLTPRLPWRALTQDELDIVSRIASGGTVPVLIDAAQQFVGYALDKYVSDSDFDPTEPRFRPLLEEAAWYVFIQSHVDLDDEAVEWMRAKLGNRAPTINALFAVYELWQDERKRRSRGLLFNQQQEQEPETPETIQADLENASDDVIKRTLLETRKLAAQRR